MVPTYRVCITSRCDVIKRRAPVYGYGSMLGFNTVGYLPVWRLTPFGISIRDDRCVIDSAKYLSSMEWVGKQK
jgi:hypothetical protein